TIQEPRSAIHLTQRVSVLLIGLPSNIRGSSPRSYVPGYLIKRRIATYSGGEPDAPGYKRPASAARHIAHQAKRVVLAISIVCMPAAPSPSIWKLVSSTGPQLSANWEGPTAPEKGVSTPSSDTDS